MGRQLHGDRLRHLVAKAWQVDACKQGFTATQNDGRQREVQLVDRSRQQILADRGNAAADLDVQGARGRLSLGERRLDAVGDEMKGRPAVHYYWRPRVVGEDESRRVVR